MERKATSGIMLTLLLASVLMSSSFVAPTNSWVYPDGTQDNEFETFGPRLDKILIKLYANEIAEFTALENNEIDITDWLLNPFYLARWSVPPYSDYIKIWSYGGGSAKAYRIDYLGTPGDMDVEDVYEGEAWYGIVNENNIGINSWWTFLNAHPADHPMGDFVAPGPGHMTMRYGFRTTSLNWLNPVYATSYWDWEVLGKIYDSGARLNPYTGQWVPQLYKRWQVGVWTDPVTVEQKSKVTITVRPDVYWSDGVPFSVADVEYTLVEMSEELLAKGLPTPWWYPSTSYIQDFKQLDPYSIEILFDRLLPSPLNYILYIDVLPKHIWKPIVAASTPANMNDPGRVHSHHPDMNLIGTGPYKLKDYLPPIDILLVANKPGSIVQTNFYNTEFGTPTLSQYGYYNQEPTYLNVIPADGKFKRNVPHPLGGPPPQNWDDFTLNITEENKERERFIWETLGPLNPADPVGSHWVGVWPPTLGPITDVHGTHMLSGITGCEFAVTSWLDNGNGFLDPSDIIDVEAIGFPGRTLWFHVEAASPPGPWMQIELKEALWVNKYVYVNGNLQPGYPIDIILVPGITYLEQIPLSLITGKHTVKAAFHIKNEWTLTKSNTVEPSPWHSHWENATINVWVTILEDIGGTYFDTWHQSQFGKGEVFAPDGLLDMKDILIVSGGIYSYPGHARWNPVADITDDYRIDYRDLALLLGRTVKSGDIAGPGGVGFSDGIVDIDDVTPIALAYISSRGPDGKYWHSPPNVPCYGNCPHHPICDLSGPLGVPDGIIDIDDVMVPALQFGDP